MPKPESRVIKKNAAGFSSGHSKQKRLVRQLYTERKKQQVRMSEGKRSAEEEDSGDGTSLRVKRTERVQRQFGRREEARGDERRARRKIFKKGTRVHEINQVPRAGMLRWTKERATGPKDKIRNAGSESWT